METKKGFRRLGVAGHIIPLVASAALFAIATLIFDLPVRAWGIISIGMGVLSYWLLWIAMRRLDVIEAGGKVESHSVLPRVIPSLAGIIAVGLGCLALVRGEREVGVTTLVAGISWIALRYFFRAIRERGE